MRDVSGVETSVKWRRVPPRAIVAKYVEHAPSIVGSIVLSALAQQFAEGQVGQIAWVVLAAAAGVRLVEPVGAWWNLRLHLDASGLWTRTGLLHHRTRYTPWSSVAAIDVGAPWHHRLLGMRVVVVRQGGGDGTSVRIDSLPTSESSSITEVWSIAAGGAAHVAAERNAIGEPTVDASNKERCATSERVPVPVYVASRGDLALASLVYGRFASLGCAGVLTASETLDSLGLLPDLTDRPLPLTVLGAAFAGLAVLGGGLAATVVRFAGLRTYLTDDAVVLRHGLLSLQERRIGYQAVVGVELRRSLIEAAFGRVRLTLLTRDSSAGLGTNLVLPSLPDDVVQRIVAGPLADRVPTAPEWMNGSRVAAVRRMTTCAAVALLVPTALAATLLHLATPVAAVVAAALVTLVLTVYIGRVAGTTVRVERAGAVVTARTDFHDQRRRSFRTAAVNASGSWSLFRRTIFRVQVYAGGVRSIVALGRPPWSDQDYGPGTAELQEVAR